MASASNATPDPSSDWEKRQAAARGESTPIGLTGWARLWARTVALALGLLIAVPLHYLFRIVSYGSPFPKWFLGYAAWVVGARVERHGTPLRRDVFFIANHVSWVDILTLAGASGTAFVAKKELATSPLVGWLASLNRTVFVQREDRLGVAAQINALREALMDNWSVTVFPESRTATLAMVAWFSTTNLSMVFMSCRRWAKVDWAQTSCAARHFLIFNSTESFVSALTSPRYVRVLGSQHLTILKSGLAFSCLSARAWTVRASRLNATVLRAARHRCGRCHCCHCFHAAAARADTTTPTGSAS